MTADIGAALKAAFTFWRTETQRVPGAIILVVLAGLAAAVEPILGWPPLWLSLSGLVQVVLSVIAYGALFRLALASAHPDDKTFAIGPAGLQWSMVEWRLLGALALTVFFAFLVLIFLVFAAFLAAIVVYAMEGAKPTTPAGFFASTGGITLIGILVLGAIPLVWALVRLSLAMPATVDRGRVQVFATWDLTKGHVLAILIAAVIVGLPVLVLGMAASFAKQSGLDGVATGLRLVTALVAGAYQFPMAAGLYSHFYKVFGGRGAVDMPHN